MTEIPVWEIYLRLMLSIVLSAVIGWERRHHGREAGMRTMPLIGLGTTTIIIVSFHIHRLFAVNGPIPTNIDPGRIAYGLITGMGFLGAGAIVKDAKHIRGLTTAACMWTVMALAIAVGYGMYGVAVAVTIGAFLIVCGLKHVERHIPQQIYHRLTVSFKAVPRPADALRALLVENRASVLALRFSRDLATKTTVVSIDVKSTHSNLPELLTDRIAALPGAAAVRWD